MVAALRHSEKHQHSRHRSGMRVGASVPLLVAVRTMEVHEAIFVAQIDL